MRKLLLTYIIGILLCIPKAFPCERFQWFSYSSLSPSEQNFYKKYDSEHGHPERNGVSLCMDDYDKSLKIVNESHPASVEKSDSDTSVPDLKPKQLIISTPDFSKSYVSTPSTSMNGFDVPKYKPPTELPKVDLPKPPDLEAIHENVENSVGTVPPVGLPESETTSTTSPVYESQPSFSTSQNYLESPQPAGDNSQWVSLFFALILCLGFIFFVFRLIKSNANKFKPTKSTWIFRIIPVAGIVAYWQWTNSSAEDFRVWYVLIGLLVYYLILLAPKVFQIVDNKNKQNFNDSSDDEQ